MFILPYDVINNIYSFDNTYKNYFFNTVLIDLKYKIYNIKIFENNINKNLLISYKNKIFIHCDQLENPQFVSTSIYNNKFPIFENQKIIKNYPEFKYILPKNKKNIIDFIENKYSKTFHPFIDIFLFY